MTQITATPKSDPSIQVTVRFDLEGVPDMRATTTITVRPDRMSIRYYWDNSKSRWVGNARVHGHRVLKSGELSDSTHEVYAPKSEHAWVAHAITAYTPKTLPELETEPMRHWSA